MSVTDSSRFEKRILERRFLDEGMSPEDSSKLSGMIIDDCSPRILQAELYGQLQNEEDTWKVISGYMEETGIDTTVSESGGVEVVDPPTLDQLVSFAKYIDGYKPLIAELDESNLKQPELDSVRLIRAMTHFVYESAENIFLQCAVKGVQNSIAAEMREMYELNLTAAQNFCNELGI